jgi:hypothetical protein
MHSRTGLVSLTASPEKPASRQKGRSYVATTLMTLPMGMSAWTRRRPSGRVAPKSMRSASAGGTATTA